MICNRKGCTKTLRSNNATGQCATNCESPEAPASHRAAGVEGGAPARRSPSGGPALKRFRTIATALGKSPDAILEDFAQTWIDALAKAAE